MAECFEYASQCGAGDEYGRQIYCYECIHAETCIDSTCRTCDSRFTCDLSPFYGLDPEETTNN